MKYSIQHLWIVIVSDAPDMPGDVGARNLLAIAPNNTQNYREDFY